MLMFHIKCGDFILSSGQKSSVYLDARKVTLHPVGGLLLGKVFTDEIRLVISEREIHLPEFVGGLELGALPIALSVAMSSSFCRQFSPLMPFVIRKEPKQHGIKSVITGQIPTANSNVILVDDVTTTGASFVKSIDALRETGCRIICAITLIDRNQGAKENLMDKHEVELRSIFTLNELIEGMDLVVEDEANLLEKSVSLCK